MTDVNHMTLLCLFVSTPIIHASYIAFNPSDKPFAFPLRV